MGLHAHDALVRHRVSGQAVAGADLDPALPAFGGEQRAGGLLDALAVGLAAGVALLVGQRLAVEATGHRGLPFGLGGPPRWRADPRAARTPVRAWHHRV